MLKRKTAEQLRYLKGAPSVQMRRVPDDVWRLREEIDAEMREEEDDAAGGGAGERRVSGVGIGGGRGAGGKAVRGERRRRERERNIGGRSEMV